MSRIINATVVTWIGLDRIANVQRATTQADDFTMLVPGESIALGPCERHAGGVNLAGVLHYLGVPSVAVGCIGDDADGSEVLASMRAKGLATTGVHPFPGARTGHNFAVDLAGRNYLYHVGASGQLTADHVSPDLFGSALFVVSMAPWTSLWLDGGAELLRLLQQARSKGCRVVLDLAFPGPTSAEACEDGEAILRKVLRHCDLFAPSYKEFLFLWNRKRYLAVRRAGPRGACPAEEVAEEEVVGAARAALNCGAGAVLMRAGRLGMVFTTASGGWTLTDVPPGDAALWTTPTWQRPAAVGSPVRNTLGAGDVTIGTFMAALVQGVSIREALMTAAFAASQSFGYGNPIDWVRKVSLDGLRVEARRAAGEG